MTSETAGTVRAFRRRRGSGGRRRLTPGASSSLVAALVCGALGGVVPALTPWTQPAAATEAYAVTKSRTFQLSGLGYGHGIGMSQFGAEGMGRLGKNYRQIVKFYYPGTNFASSKARRQITVGLSGVVRSTTQGSAVVVIDRPGITAWNRGDAVSLPRRVGGAHVTSYRVVRGSGGLAVYAVSSARVSKVKGGLSGAVTFRTDANIAASKVAVSTSSGSNRLYRGFLDVKRGSTGVLAVGRLRLEDYLRSVVSHEVPSSWTAAALRAQAVAARSYALMAQASSRAAHRPYDICDSTSCQAYGPIGGETGAESRAVRATRGVYLRSGGQPVLAMYSSANGGYSVAGGRPYLVAQPDPYDGVVTGTANWGHKWTTKVRAGAIERAWPQIGRLQKVKVLGRDGNGQWGGRVQSVGLVGRQGTVTVSADSFRWAVGLKSTWWTITNADSRVTAPAKNVRVKRADRSAVVRWGAPDTERRVEGYRVSVAKSDDVYRVGRAARKVRVKGLTNGKEYRAVVSPVYRSGPGPKVATPAFVPTSPFSYFQPMGVRRVLDRGETRPLDHDGQVSAVVTGGGGLAPSSGTRAVAIRVVAKSSRKAGRVTAWPCGAPDRDQVAVTYQSGGSSAGLATLPLRSNGRLCLGASTALSAVSVDLLGYYTASGVGTKAFRAVAPRRMVNSETGLGWSEGRLASGEPRTVRIAGREGVPTEVRTVLLSVGLAHPNENATLSVAPSGTPVSLGAVVRAPARKWRTATTVVKLDEQGRLPLRLTQGKTHVHLELLGWFTPQGGDRPGRYRAIKSRTVLDATSGAMSMGENRAVRVRGGETGVPGGASAVAVQMLASGAGEAGEGYVTARPEGSSKVARPVLAFDRRGVQRTLVVVPVGEDGKIEVTSELADASLSLRLVGWYS